MNILPYFDGKQESYDQKANEAFTFAELVLDSKVSVKYQHNSKAKEYIEVFSGNHALFFMTTIGKLSEFRNMETDYGILPYVM